MNEIIQLVMPLQSDGSGPLRVHLQAGPITVLMDVTDFRAGEAGRGAAGTTPGYCPDAEMVREWLGRLFAAAVAEEREQAAKVKGRAAVTDERRVVNAIRIAVAEEREACAKLVNSMLNRDIDSEIVPAIRARSLNS
jgi:hypothetical protein